MKCKTRNLRLHLYAQGESNTTGMKKNLMCELQVRYKHKKRINRVKITQSNDAEILFRGVIKEEISIREVLVALFLNKANYVIGYAVISIGGKAGTVVDNKIILSTALLSGASGIIICHNHPSGNTSPSKQDHAIVKKLHTACNTMDITFLDNLILTEEGYLSFSDEGYMP